MSTTEERIVTALTAHAGGITMDTSTMEKRFAEVRERTQQDRRRRRGIGLAVGALATAAAVVAALTLAGDVLGGDPTSAPRVAERVLPPEPPPADVPVTGEVFPVPGTTYVLEAFAVPFSLQVPDKGDVPGTWRIGPPEETLAGVGLDNSVLTGHASLSLLALEQSYAPDRPWTQQTELVAAPTDADGWQRWLEATGFAQVTERTAIEVSGLPATRMTVDVAADLPPAYDGCTPRLGCLALRAFGSTVGEGSQVGLMEGTSVELVVLQVGDRPLLLLADGAPETSAQWLPLMRSVVESLDFR